MALIRNDSNHKIAGEIKNKEYHKTVIKKNHMFRAYNGYGISDDILEELQKEGIELVVLKEKDTKRTYITALQNFFRFSRKIDFGDKQTVLSMDKWEEE